MKLKVTRTIDIDLEEIKRDICERACSVKEAVDDYVCGLYDDEYYIVCEEKDKIIEALKEEGFED